MRWRVLGFIGHGGYDGPPSPTSEDWFGTPDRRADGHTPIEFFGTHTSRAASADPS
jgi:hypothetical protein